MIGYNIMIRTSKSRIYTSKGHSQQKVLNPSICLLHLKDKCIQPRGLWSGNRIGGQLGIGFRFRVSETNIPKTRTKDIALEGEDDFTEMVGQVQAKKNAEGTLVLIENKIDNGSTEPVTIRLSFQMLHKTQMNQMMKQWGHEHTHTQKKCTNVPDSDDDDTRQSNGQKKAKKQSQTHEPNAEEEEQDRIIKDLQDRYHCENKACPYNICWPAGTSVNDHVNNFCWTLHKHSLVCLYLQDKCVQPEGFAVRY
ncbi:hypothetical protein EV424DRAFT_1348109 [Suillus variegatus]|nr:hypothetical protein EV424DRAFT_1348109 [Suillus variegatus]